MVTFLQDHTQWPKLKQDLDSIVMPFARSKGGEVFGALGTCWGSYMVLRECGTYPEEVSQKCKYCQDYITSIEHDLFGISRDCAKRAMLKSVKIEILENLENLLISC